MPRLHINTITLDTFNAVLSRYPSAAPPKLRDLDTLRYDTIPANFAARRGKDASLTKSEVEQLVEWKLKHGTFRPKLLALVQSNPSAAITAATQQGFAALAPADADAHGPAALAAVKRVAQLKGVGPATASLLLSVMSPGTVPFFSDELFRWCVWEGEGKPRGWKRVIKYNVKEYGEVLEGVEGLRRRLGERVRAVDVERVAWVLGREGVDVGVDAEGGAEGEGEGERASEGVGEERKEDDDSGEREAHGATVEKSVSSANRDVPAEPVSKKSTKRKASSAKPPQEGVRKSTRTKR